MKILSIMGSPRVDGNTAVLHENYLKGIKRSSNEFEIEEVVLREKKIDMCKGCTACKSGKIKYCVIKDGMDGLFRSFSEAKLVVLSTPVYWSNMSSHLKVFTDRLFATTPEDWKGKKIVLLMTYGDKDEETSGAVNLIKIMESFVKIMGGEIILKYGTSTRYQRDFVETSIEIKSDINKVGFETMESLK